MANQLFKAVVNAAAFPFSYRQASRTVLVAGQDIASRTNYYFAGSPDSIDYNLIQLVYAENILPIAKGLQSVSYATAWTPYSGATDFDQAILVKDSVNNNVAFCPARGKNYVYNPVGSAWVSYAPFTFAFSKVTFGYVNGRTLIFYERTKCVEWDPSVPTMQTRTLTLPIGYAITDIRGNSAASNYHLLFTDVMIMWSTLSDVLDFATDTQGAGRQIPIDLKGKITAVYPIAGGFLIYTTKNVIAATFTNDSTRPFAFREVQNSAGVNSSEQITGDANADGHYVYGAAGIQLVTLQGATSVFPEASDFLTSNSVDYWDTTTKRVLTTVLSQVKLPKLQLINSRYLVISYSTSGTQYEYALIYDVVLKRWGKLKVTHVDCMEAPFEAVSTSYAYYAMESGYDTYTATYGSMVAPTPGVLGLRQNFAFLQADGTVVQLIMQEDVVAGSGVAIFGRVQVERSRYVTITDVDLDGLASSPVPVVTLLGSDTGDERNLNNTPMVIKQTPRHVEYQTRFTALNIDVAVEGRMVLTTLIIGTMAHGKR